MKLHPTWFGLAALLLLTACDGGGDFTPRAKEAHYDATTGELVLPHPCPDWSKGAITNYSNSLNSNYGCAVNNNLAQQLADPADLAGNNASHGPDTEITAGVVDQYRSGKIPQPLTPLQATPTGGQ